MIENSDVLSAEPLTTAQVAARYQVPEPSVKDWRRSRTGPAYFYAGRHVRYRLADLIDWEATEAGKTVMAEAVAGHDAQPDRQAS